VLSKLISLLNCWLFKCVVFHEQLFNIRHLDLGGGDEIH